MLVYVVRMWGNQKVYSNRERAISECRTSLKEFLNIAVFNSAYRENDIPKIIELFNKRLYTEVRENLSGTEDSWYEFSVYECLVED